MNISQIKRILALVSIRFLKNDKKNAQKVSIHMTSEQVDHPKYLNFMHYNLYRIYIIIFRIAQSNVYTLCTIVFTANIWKCTVVYFAL